MRDLDSVWMAAFTVRDPDDRAAFDARMTRLRGTRDITLHAVRGKLTNPGLLLSSSRGWPRCFPDRITALLSLCSRR
jgi:hypothetical protein